MYYACFDTASLPAFMEQARAFGSIDPSDSSISLAESLNSFTSLLRKLGLGLKFHGSAVVAFDNWPLEWAYELAVYGSAEGFDAMIPGYEWSNLVGIDHAESTYCPDDA
jgi:hypothetical protein